MITNSDSSPSCFLPLSVWRLNVSSDLRTKMAQAFRTLNTFLLHKIEIIFFFKTYLLYIPLSVSPFLPDPSLVQILMQILPSLLLWEGGVPSGYFHSPQPPTHWFTEGLCVASPTEARHCGPVRVMGPTCRLAADSGKTPIPVVGDLLEDQAAHLHMCRRPSSSLCLLFG